jgi:hypothetical protein
MRKYVYGFLDGSQPKKFELSGVEKAGVYTVTHQRLSAAISDTTLEEVLPTRGNVLAHTIVQDTLLKSYSLLPASFGTVANNEEAVVSLLTNNYGSLVDDLNRLSGKWEVALKISWDEQAMSNQLQSSGELAQIKAKLAATSSAIITQSLLSEAGRIVQEVAEQWRTNYAQRIYDYLSKLAVDAKLNKSAGIKNLLNASFLIDIVKEPEFKKEVYTMDSEHKGKVNFKYVGPLPPYNFVNTRLMMAE